MGWIQAISGASVDHRRLFPFANLSIKFAEGAGVIRWDTAGGPMSRFFHAQEIAKPEDVIRYLAKRERHWKRGYSAYELAHSWVNAGDIPVPVRSVLDTCSDYAGVTLVEGLFERDVDLRTPGRRSQTDLLAFVHSVHGNAVIAVEGKVDEPFGDLVSTWNDGSPGKERRLKALCRSLGLGVADIGGGIRYQLLHRTASAIYEAQRYRAMRALMLVHSFSATDTSFPDFQAFSRSMGLPVEAVNRVSGERDCEGIRLRLAWVKDQPRL